MGRKLRLRKMFKEGMAWCEMKGPGGGKEMGSFKIICLLSTCVCMY